MIEPLDLSDPANAGGVLAMQRAAYAVEAELIAYDGVPPLLETLEQLVAEPLEWRGIREGGRIVAAIAISGAGRRCDVDRLVVDPQHHRRGYGRRHDHLKTSFDADVAGYEAARPGYPDDVFHTLTQRCGLGPNCTVLEIGPGPGQATMALLDRGASVVAVEPGSGMVARLSERVAGRRCTVIHSNFEVAPLVGPFDLAVAATSFHWVDPVAGVAKLADLVASGGWLALWWNVFRDLGPNDAAFSERLRPIAQRFQTAERMEAVTYALDESARRTEIEAGGHFALEAVETYEWSMRHDAASLRALFASFSDWSTLPEPDRSRALDDVAAIVDDRFGGVIDRRYLTMLYVARRR